MNMTNKLIPKILRKLQLFAGSLVYLGKVLMRFVMRSHLALEIHNV